MLTFSKLLPNQSDHLSLTDLFKINGNPLKNLKPEEQAGLIIKLLIHLSKTISRQCNDVNDSMLSLFGATQIQGDSKFTTALRRKEDKLIIKGLKPHIIRALKGEDIQVLEMGGGVSWPRVDKDHVEHYGSPWLSRIIASALQELVPTLKITTSNIEECKNQDIIFKVRPSGALSMRVIENSWRIDCPSLSAEVSQYKDGKPVQLSLEQVKQFMDNSLNGTREFIDNEQSRIFILPMVDPQLEEMFGLNIKHDNSYSYTSPDIPEKYDYVFGRHFYPEHADAFRDCVHSLQEVLTKNGTARICFDYYMALDMYYIINSNRMIRFLRPRLPHAICKK